MPVLNIRNFPLELRKKLKMKAIVRELELRDLVIEYLQQGLERDKAHKDETPRQAKPENPISRK
jgi:hypothetical protein